MEFLENNMENMGSDEVPEVNFARHFMPAPRVIIENISYETETPHIENGSELRLGVKDTVVAQINVRHGVKVTFNRTLSFDPEGPFRLSVSFATHLSFNPKTAGEIDWKKVDVAAEFRKKCPGLMQNMMSRAALLVAEITSASGGNPIIPVK